MKEQHEQHHQNGVTEIFGPLHDVYRTLPDSGGKMIILITHKKPLLPKQYVYFKG